MYSVYNTYCDTIFDLNLYCLVRSLSSSILSLTLCSWSPTWKKITLNQAAKFWKRLISRDKLLHQYSWSPKNIKPKHVPNIPRKYSSKNLNLCLELFKKENILEKEKTSISALMFSHTGLLSRLLLPLSSFSLSSFSFRPFALTLKGEISTSYFVFLLASSSLLLSIISSLSWAVRL